MTLMFGVDNGIFLFAVICIALLCIAIIFFIRKPLRRSDRLGDMKLDPSRPPLRVKKIPAYHEEITEEKELILPDPDKKLNCLEGKKNISESLAALAERFSLDEVTLATSDGLLLASSTKVPAAEAIAKYSEMYADNLRPWPPGILLFGLEHKGSSLVGIAKSRDLLAQEADPDLLRETKDILNWWI